MLTTFYNHVIEAAKQENLSLKEVSKQINEHGIKGVEIDYRDLDPTGRNFNKELAGELSDAGIPIFGCYVFYDWGRHPFDISYKRIYKNLASIGVKNSLAIPGMLPKGMDPKKAMRRMAKRLKKAVACANSLGITVLLEDFDDCIAPFSTAAGMKYFFDEVKDLKCAFDTGNFFYSDEDVLEKLPMFIDNTAYVHCKDRSLDVKEGEEPKATVSGVNMYSSPVGSGVIPMKEIIERLLKHGYKGSFAIEHFGSKHQLSDMITSADYLNELLSSCDDK